MVLIGKIIDKHGILVKTSRETLSRETLREAIRVHPWGGNFTARAACWVFPRGIAGTVARLRVRNDSTTPQELVAGAATLVDQRWGEPMAHTWLPWHRRVMGFIYLIDLGFIWIYILDRCG